MTEVLTAPRALAQWVERMPDREFLLQPAGQELRATTFAAADDQARRIATALTELGLAPGLSLTWQLLIWAVSSAVFTLLWFKLVRPRMKDQTKAGIAREAVHALRSLGA